MFDLMGANRPSDDTQHLLDWATGRGATEFSRREAYAPHRARFADPADDARHTRTAVSVTLVTTTAAP